MFAVKQVKIGSTMQLCSDSLYMHVLKRTRTAVCQLPSPGIFLDATAWSGVHVLYVATAALALLLYLWKGCSCISFEMPLCCASKCALLPLHQ